MGVPGRLQAPGPVPGSASGIQWSARTRDQEMGGVQHVQTILSYQGDLHVKLLQSVFCGLVEQHEVLRSKFPADAVGAGVPHAGSQPLAALAVPVHDLQGFPPRDREARLKELLSSVSSTPFAAGDEVLLRCHAVRLDHAEWRILLVAPQLVADARSLDVLARDLGQRYAAAPALGGPVVSGPAPEAWPRRGEPQGPELQRLQAHWERELASSAAVNIPLDRPPRNRRARLTADHPFGLDRDLMRALVALATREGVAPAEVLMTALAALVHRWSGDSEVTIGALMSVRPVLGVDEDVIGPLSAKVALHSQARPGSTLRELLHQLHEADGRIREYGQLSLPRLQEPLPPGPRAASPPVFQVLFSYRGLPGAVAPGQAIFAREPSCYEVGTSPSDLTCFLDELPDGGISGCLRYSADLFDPETMEQIAGVLQLLAHQLADDADAGLWQVPIMSAIDRSRIVSRWNATAVQLPQDRTLTGLFAEQVRARRDAAAIVYLDEEVSYGELDSLASRVAGSLVAAGVRRGDRVGVHAHRGIGTIAALLGILRAGAAYVPLDPDNSAVQLAYIVADCGMSAVLTQPELPAIPGVTSPMLNLADCLAGPPGAPAANACFPESTAYIIYTSGTTGTPKGTLIPHLAVVRLVKGANYADLGPDEVILHQSPLSFDASVLEIWGALLNGALMAIAPRDDDPIGTTVTAIKRHRVTLALLISPQFHLIMDRRPEDLQAVRQLLVGGDVLSSEHVRRAVSTLTRTRLSNVYGPTETTLFASHFPSSPAYEYEGRVPIGWPISNTTCYIFDELLEPVPVGFVGELYVGGDGVADGYLNQPALTAERFVPDPFSRRPGARLYRTGDIGRYLRDGAIDFLGRWDDQVKVRGYRVELGQIETTLAQAPGVAQASVIPVDESHTKRLVAFVVAESDAGTIAGAQLRQYVAERLPPYMVPDAFVPLGALPLTANGKLDRRELTSAVGQGTHAGEPFNGPRTATETRLSLMWQTALETSAPLGVTEKFFDVGGNSLRMFHLFEEISYAYDDVLELGELFVFNTIESLATEIDARLAAREAEPGRQPEPDGNGPQ